MYCFVGQELCYYYNYYYNFWAYEKQGPRLPGEEKGNSSEG